MKKCPNCGADLADEKDRRHNCTNNTSYTYNSQNTQKVKYCTYCGNQCDPSAVICVRCGAPFNNSSAKMSVNNDRPSGLLKFFCFFIPILGLILYLVNMDNQPISAKAYGKTALIGFILGIIFYIVFIIGIFLIIPLAFGYSVVTDTFVYSDPEIYLSITNYISSFIK